MGDWNYSCFHPHGQITHSTVATAPPGVTLTAHTTTHTKGSWSTVEAAVDHDVFGAYVQLGHVGSGTTPKFLVDIGVGAASSEVVIIENIAHTQGTSDYHPHTTAAWFPVNIPSGTRIAARCQSDVSSATVDINISYSHGTLFSEPIGSAIITYGANTGTSQGVTITPNVGSYPASWTQVDASIAETVKAINIVMQGDPAGGYTQRPIYVQFAIGAASSEQIILSDLNCAKSSREDIWPRQTGWLPLHIETGQRISARAQTPSGASENFYMTVHGVR